MSHRQNTMAHFAERIQLFALLDKEGGKMWP